MNIHCILCEVQQPMFDDTSVHPSDGTAFYTSGHYGSTVFDPMDGTVAEIVICNSCLTGHKEKFLYISEPSHSEIK